MIDGRSPTKKSAEGAPQYDDKIYLFIPLKNPIGSLPRNRPCVGSQYLAR